MSLWNAVRDFITFFTKYKTYLSHIIIFSFYIIILSSKEIRLFLKKYDFLFDYNTFF